MRRALRLAGECALAAGLLIGVVAARNALLPPFPDEVWVLSGGDASAASEHLEGDADSRALWTWVGSNRGLHCFHEPDAGRPMFTFYVSLIDYWGAGTPDRPSTVTLARIDPAFTEWELCRHADAPSRRPIVQYAPVGGVLAEVGSPGVVDAGELGGVWLLYRRRP